MKYSIPVLALLLYVSVTEAEVTSSTSPWATVEKRIPSISIIIDDMGDRPEGSLRAAHLPGPVACAILPHSPLAANLAETAFGMGKEILLHLPMESVETKKLGPGGLTLDMTQREVEQIIRADVDAIPHVSGVNNHMGSLLTQHPGYMEWIMRTLGERADLFFIDSRTSPKTVAQQLAREYRVPTARRDIFLDNIQDEAYILKQFQKLVSMAQRNGAALGIGHPYPQTLAVLERIIPKLDQHGVRLISLTDHIKFKQEGELKWRASLSR